MVKWCTVRIQHHSFRQLDVTPLRIALGLDGNSAPYPQNFAGDGSGEDSSTIFNLFFLNKQKDCPMEEPSLYWWTWLGLIGISSIALIRKHPLVILTLVPAVIAYLQIGHAVEDHVRFYMQSLPLLIVAPWIVYQYHPSKIEEGTHYHSKSGFLLMIALPYLSVMSQHHWTIEREISHKMLSQAHPNDRQLQNRNIVFGTPIHIQTLPVTQIERQITQTWDEVCTDTLRQHPPTLWFESP